MMKRIMCLVLALSVVLALSACGAARDAKQAVESMLPSMDPMATDFMETAMPETTADPGDNGNFPHPDATDAPDASLSAQEVLRAIADAGEDDNAVATYAAAAKVLNFCKQGGTEGADFASEVKSFVKGLDDGERDRFRDGYDRVVTLAQSIARGDVEQGELEKNLTAAGAGLEEFDPVNFQHDNLVVFAETIRTALGK